MWSHTDVGNCDLPFKFNTYAIFQSARRLFRYLPKKKLPNKLGPETDYGERVPLTLEFKRRDYL